MPKVNIDGYSDEQCAEIQKQHKQLLEYSRDNNDNKEVAFVFRNDLLDRTKFLGEDDKLDFGTGLLGKGNDLIVMHNHPRNSSFSFGDLVEFIGNQSIRTLTVVKNNGEVEVLTKLKKYNKLDFLVELDRLKKKTVKMDSDVEYQKVINKFTKKYENQGVIKWLK